MKRWRIVVSYLDRPARAFQFEDVYSLGSFERSELSHGVWRMEPAERLYGPALSRDEYEQGYRVRQSGHEWVVYEPVTASGS